MLRDLVQLVCLMVAALAIGNAVACVDVDGGDNACGPAPERPVYTSITFADGNVIQSEAQWRSHNDWANAMQEWALCVEGVNQQ